MLALHAASRTLLAAAAFASFGAAFVTTPMVARGDAGVSAGLQPPVTVRPVTTILTEIVPQRDPFAGGDAPALHSSAAPQQAPVTMPALPLPQIPAALRALPPNAGAGDTAFPFGAAVARSSAVVTAVITGPHPYALVDEGGTTRVLTVGDRIDGDAITAIGAGGVRLSRGTLLAVAPASGTVLPPQLPAPAVAPAVPVPTPLPPNPGGR